MKSLKFLSLITSIIVLTACGGNSNSNNSNADKQDTTQTDQEEATQNSLEPVAGSATVGWTSYKTTERVPVKGTFNSVKVGDFSIGNTLEEVLNNATFSINPFDLSTGDTSRDGKIEKSFFGSMVNLNVISGKILYSDDNWFVEIKMNGVTKKLPAEITMDDNNMVHLITTVHIKDFDAEKALEAFNKVCKDLHKGKDGVSKTWDVVDVTASLKMKKSDQ